MPPDDRPAGPDRSGSAPGDGAAPGSTPRACGPPSRREVAGLVAITAVAAAVRFTRIGHQSFWLDESYTVDLVHRSFSDMLEGVSRTESTPPLYYVLAWLWAKLFGTTEAGLRSLSALFGTIAVPVAWGAAREWFSGRAALIAAALVAVNPFFVWYSQEARSYELLVLMAALTLLFLARALRNPTPRALALWSLTAALALLTHYFAVFLLVPEAAWLLWGTRRGRATPSRAPSRPSSEPTAVLSKDLAPAAKTLLPGQTICRKPQGAQKEVEARPSGGERVVEARASAGEPAAEARASAGQWAVETGASAGERAVETEASAGEPAVEAGDGPAEGRAPVGAPQGGWRARVGARLAPAGGALRGAWAAVGAVVAVGVALLPLALHQRDLGHTSFIADLSLKTRLVDLPKKLVTGELGTPTPLIGPIAGLIAAAALAYALAKTRPARGLAATAAAAALVPIVATLAGADYLLPRNLIAVYVPVVLAVAAGLAAATARLGSAAAAVICVVALVVNVEVATDAKLQRDDWRGAATKLAPAQAVLVTPDYEAKSLRLYAPSLEPIPPQGADVTQVVTIANGRPPPPPPAPPGFTEQSRTTTKSYVLTRYTAPTPHHIPPGPGALIQKGTTP